MHQYADYTTCAKTMVIVVGHQTSSGCRRLLTVARDGEWNTHSNEMGLVLELGMRVEHASVITTVTYYIYSFITNEGAQCENSKTSTDMRTAVKYC